MESVRIFYHDKLAAAVLAHNLGSFLAHTNREPIFLCIGSDHHILDCMGPLTGTMLQALIPGVTVIGTLDAPLHARNMAQSLSGLEQTRIGRSVIAIDASVGNQNEIGLLQLRRGSLSPGKALAKTLPALGDYAMTGVVDVRANRSGVRTKHAGLGLIYNMAEVLSQSIAEFYQFKFGF